MGEWGDSQFSKHTSVQHGALMSVAWSLTSGETLAPAETPDKSIENLSSSHRFHIASVSQPHVFGFDALKVVTAAIEQHRRATKSEEASFNGGNCSKVSYGGDLCSLAFFLLDFISLFFWL